jgi:hypothetical protein
MDPQAPQPYMPPDLDAPSGPETQAPPQQNPYAQAPPMPMQPSYAQQPAAGPGPGPGMPPPPMPGAPNTTQVKSKSNPNSTQNALQIAEIRDGIVIMNDGTFRSVVMLKSINFDLMSPQEQESVEYAYQGFLNSLYFPVQIFVRTQRIDLRPYIERLDKIRTEHDNMLLSMLMEDYIIYIDQLSAQTNIMDKKFYVVIPYLPHPESAKKALKESKNFFSGLTSMFSSTETHVVINEADLETAKNELRNRVQAVLGGLNQCGVQGLPLDTQELIELYYDTYNPDTATRQQLKNFSMMQADVVTKGQGNVTKAHLQRELD